MAQSAASFERSIYKALLTCSGNAKGLFAVMRYWSEHNPERPGFVEQDGRPMSREALALEARCTSPAESPDPFAELRSVRDAKGQPLLLTQDGRTFVLPIIVKLFEFRRRRSEAAMRSMKKRVLNNALVGVKQNAFNTPVGVNSPPTSPPEVSPPITPSSYPPSPSPSPSSLGAGEAADSEQGPEDIDSRIRRWIGGHRMLMWDRKTHGKFRKLVEVEGWDAACDMVDEGVASGAPYPVGWALAKSEKTYQARRASSKPKKNGNIVELLTRSKVRDI